MILLLLLSMWEMEAQALQDMKLLDVWLFENLFWSCDAYRRWRKGYYQNDRLERLVIKLFEFSILTFFLRGGGVESKYKCFLFIIIETKGQPQLLGELWVWREFLPWHNQESGAERQVKCFQKRQANALGRSFNYSKRHNYPYFAWKPH